MFGYVIQIRDTLFVLGISCIIAFVVFFILKLSSTPGTNRREGYDLLLNFSTYFILIPGIFFIIAYYLFVARIGLSSKKLTNVSKAKQARTAKILED